MIVRRVAVAAWLSLSLLGATAVWAADATLPAGVQSSPDAAPPAIAPSATSDPTAPPAGAPAPLQPAQAQPVAGPPTPPLAQTDAAQAQRPTGRTATPPLATQPAQAGGAAPAGTVAAGAGADGAVATGAAEAPEPDQDSASTIELLDEDTRLEHAHEEGGDATPGETAEQDENAAGAEPDAAAALTPDGTDGAAPPATAEDSGELFPSSPGIEKQKAFWIRIFTHYDSHQGVLHDGRIALPVYEDLDLTGMRYRTQRHFVRERKRQLAAHLRELAHAVAAGAPLEPAQQALLQRLPAGSSPGEIREFADNVRFQRGLADRFRDGLIRSGALLEPMKRMLARHGVPEDLVYLPHVESSFNNATLSKFGAAGIWQFTRGTGRMFMKVGYEVDERLDPIIASEAAARFLRQNYERLGTWPLAITAYNHGPQSLERITRRMGTRDLAVLIENYDGRLFKFASKNFYAEFLAAREVAQDYERFFGPIQLQSTLQYDDVELPWHVEAQDMADALDLDLPALRRLNPALRDAVWSGAKYIPAGFTLRIPAEADGEALLAAIPEEARHEHQKRSLYVRVARGDTLYSIGRRHGIAWRSIALANNIDSARRLRPGQKLILPWNGVTPPVVQVAGQSEPAAAQAEDASATQGIAAEQIVERIPVQPGAAAAPWRGGKPPEDGAEPLADRFQELRVVTYNAQRKEGEIVAAYGETVGVYSNWAGVTPGELRRLNDMSSRSVLRPGERYLVPLDTVTPEAFQERRMAFHRDREQSFFAEYDITEKVKIEVQRGQSPWNIAQDNNVPMWLFYRENPQLLTEPLRVGMQVILPVVQAGGQAPR